MSCKKQKDISKETIRRTFLQTFLHIHTNYLADRVLTLGLTAPKVAKGVDDARANDYFRKKVIKTTMDMVIKTTMNMSL